jgi:hypothetical protein
VKVFKYIIVLIFLSACKEQVEIEHGLTENHNQKHSFRKDTLVNLYELSITLPKGWRFANDDTLVTLPDATARYRFHNSSGKLIFLQYGLGTIGNPAEPNVQSFRFRKGYVENKADTSDFIFTDNAKLAAIRDKSGHTYTTESISGFQALLYQPKKSSVGYTGLYIDSIGVIGGNIADFTFYAKDLNTVESEELSRVMHSIKLKPFK